MYTHAKCNAILEHNILIRLAESWSARVAVRNKRLDLQQFYDPAIPDFPISMVPFWNDPDFQSISDKDKIRVLAGAWIAYNEKTIYIEDRIINPTCTLLLSDGLPGVSDPIVKQVLAQTLVDEQFHILMCLEVCNCARLRHDMQDFHMPEPQLGKRIETTLAETENETDLAIARMAYGTVAEMTINAFLKQLSSDTTIQPLNRLNTDLHRKDESGHAVIFGEVARSVYRNLPDDKKIIFKNYIVRAIRDFVEVDLTFWHSILDYLFIPTRKEIMDALAVRSVGKRAERDYTSFLSFISEIDMRDEINFVFN